MKGAIFSTLIKKKDQHKNLRYMRNQDILHRIESLINTLKDIQLANNTAINELETIKWEIVTTGEQTGDSSAKPRDIPKANSSREENQEHLRPDTTSRNMGPAPSTQHTDNKGNVIEVGDMVRVLNLGLFKGNKGIVTKLGKARVSLRLTNRKSTNLEVVTKDV